MNRWKIATWLLLLFLCIVLLGSFRQREPDTKRVEAEEFVLKDSSGRTRAVLGINDGKPLMEFYDEKGTVTAKVPDKGLKQLGVR